MKKKVVTLIGALVCAMSMSACNATEEGTANVELSVASGEMTTKETLVAERTTESVAEAVASNEVEAVDYETPAGMSDDLLSFQIAVNGELYQVPMWYSDFESMGWTYEGDVTTELASNQYVIREEWTKDGVTVFTSIANLSMNTKTVKDSAVSSLSFEGYSSLVGSGWKIELPKGIVYGVSTKEDVIAAYGEPESSYENSYYQTVRYSAGGYQCIDFCFDAETGVITLIELENIVEMEGLDNSVNPEVPDIVADYEAPTSVSEDLYGFDVKIEGNYYSFPCPVSAFVENGFTVLVESDGKNEMASGESGSIRLEYNGLEYRYWVANYADYATTLENCFIYDFDASNYEKDVALEVPHGIKCGITEDELVSKLEGYDYERTDYGTAGIGYRFYNRDDKYNSYIFDVDDGVVTKIGICAGWSSKE